ncbi:hypothetical protein EZI54_06755 [Marinobacter halodurans]|uniref:Uncharacterized protein n=1 Tax=Marinobacter halodurans TaxID=2528979 RepID=A0ABY1ZR45_9GAMM|nr:hypothetical protein [Marinobacter halodurans]TBW57350.1 hypothetical protein EZI54_06755 [Marinobacter halodurans]
MADSNNPFAGTSDALEMPPENEALFDELAGLEVSPDPSPTVFAPLMTITGRDSHLFVMDPETNTVRLANDEVAEAFATLQEAIEYGGDPSQIEIDAHVFSPVTGKLEKVSDFMPEGTPYRDLVQQVGSASKTLAVVPRAITALTVSQIILPTPLEAAGPSPQNMRRPEDELDSDESAEDRFPGAEDEDAEAELEDQRPRSALPQPTTAVESAVFGAITLAYGLAGVAGYAIKSTITEGWNLTSMLGTKLWHNVSQRREEDHRAYAESDEIADHRLNEPQVDIPHYLEASNDEKAAFGEGVEKSLELIGVQIEQPVMGNYDSSHQAIVEPKITADVTNLITDNSTPAVPPELMIAGETSMATNQFVHSHDVGDRINAWASKNIEANEQAKADIHDMASQIDARLAQVADYLGTMDSGSDERNEALQSERAGLEAFTKDIGQQCREWIADPQSNYSQSDSEQKEELVDDLEAMFDPDNNVSPFHRHKDLLEEMEDENGGFKAGLSDAFQGLKDLLARLKEALGIMTVQKAEAEEMDHVAEHAPAGPSL